MAQSGSPQRRRCGSLSPAIAPLFFDNLARAGGCAGTNYPFLTLKERDYETSLDYFEARFYSPAQGRFSSPDPMIASGVPGNPQTFNRYSYVRNNSLNLVDPTGMITEGIRHDDSDSAAEAFSRQQELRHMQLPLALRQDPRNPPQKPPTKFGPPDANGSVEILGAGDIIVSNISANDGVADTSFAFSFGSFAATGAEYYFVSPNGTRWRGINGKWNNMTWGGNQYTGGRALAVAKAGVFRVGARTFFFTGAAISGYQGYQNFRQQNYAGAAKNGLDIGMSAVGTFCGPYGVAVSGVYFTADTIGWKNIADSQLQVMQETEKVTGKSWSQHMGPIYEERARVWTLFGLPRQVLY